MYMYHAREILDLPGVLLVAPRRDAMGDPPTVDVRYDGRHIGHVMKDFMDRAAHREVRERAVAPEEPDRTAAEMLYREAWPGLMARIEAKLPRWLRPRMRKKARRLGFRWWR